MPSSPSESIPYIIEFVRKNNPDLQSVLDVGIGFGKMGYLFREYFDVKKDLVYQPKDWKLHITGIEIFPEYVSEIQRRIYNEIILGDVFEVLPTLKQYDVAILSDVLEHFTKEKGQELLRMLFEHVESVVIATPSGFLEHPSRNNNPYENHLSGWTLDDFKNYTVMDSAVVKQIRGDQQTLIAYLRK